MEIALAGGFGLFLTATFLISGLIGLERYADAHSEVEPD